MGGGYGTNMLCEVWIREGIQACLWLWDSGGFNHHGWDVDRSPAFLCQAMCGVRLEERASIHVS